MLLLLENKNDKTQRTLGVIILKCCPEGTNGQGIMTPHLRRGVIYEGVGVQGSSCKRNDLMDDTGTKSIINVVGISSLNSLDLFYLLYQR